jgi:type II secretory pathway pseudopilin PulG
MRKLNIKEAGFTLIESLVAAFIGVIVLAVVISVSIEYLKYSREQSAQNALNDQSNSLIAMVKDDVQIAGTGSALDTGGAGPIGKSSTEQRCGVYVSPDGKSLDVWHLTNGGSGTVAETSTTAGVSTVVLLGSELTAFANIPIGGGVVVFPKVPSVTSAPGILTLTELPRASTSTDFGTPGDFANVNQSLCVTLKGRLNQGTCFGLTGERATIASGDFVAPFRRLIRYSSTTDGMLRTEYEMETAGCGLSTGTQVTIPKQIVPDYTFAYYLGDGSISGDVNAGNRNLMRGIFLTLKVQDPGRAERFKTTFTPIFVKEWSRP